MFKKKYQITFKRFKGDEPQIRVVDAYSDHNAMLLVKFKADIIYNELIVQNTKVVV